MRIKNFELNDLLIKELGKFTVLWNLFERNYCDYNCNPDKINEIGQNVFIDEEKLRDLYRVINIRRIWFMETVEEYATISLHPENSRMSKEEFIGLIADFIAYKGDRLNVGCLLTILRIRNNLMHGLKIAEQLNNQLELFKAVNGVLESI